MKRACLFFTWLLFILLACCNTAWADKAMRPLVLERSGPERQLPERLLGASAEPLIEHLDGRSTQSGRPGGKWIWPSCVFRGGSQANYYNSPTGLLDMPVTPRSSAYMRFWAGIAPEMRTGFPPGVETQSTPVRQTARC